MGSSTLLEHHGMAMADSPLPAVRLRVLLLVRMQIKRPGKGSSQHGDAKRSVLQLNKRAREEEGEENRFQAPASPSEFRKPRQNCSRCQPFEHLDPYGVGFWNLTKCTEGRILESGPRLLLPSVILIARP